MLLKKNLLILLGSGLLLSTVACSQGGGGRPDAINEPDPVVIVESATVIEPSKGKARLFFDDVGVIPLVTANKQVVNTKNKILVKINNSLEQPFTLNSIRVLDPENMEAEAPALASIKSNACHTVQAWSSCTLSVTSNLSKSGSFILEASLTATEGNSPVIIRQIIRASDKVGSNDGIMFRNDLDEIITSDGKYSMSFPVHLTDSFTSIKASNGYLVCPNNDYQAGATCSYLVSGEALNGKTLIATDLEGIKKDGGKVVSSYRTVVNTNDAAKLRLVQPRDVVLNAEKSAATTPLVIFNAGNQVAMSLSPELFANSLLNIASTTCTTSLNPGSSCLVNIAVSSKDSGFASVGANYDQSKNVADLVQTNFRYLNSDKPLAFDIEHLSGSLLKSVLNNDNYLDLRVRNLGADSLKNMGFSLSDIAEGTLVAANNSATNEATCSLDGKYTLDTSCRLRVKYHPKTKVDLARLFNLNVSGTDQNGLSHSLNWGQTYSTLTGFNVLTMIPSLLELRSLVNMPDPMTREVRVTNVSGLTANLGKTELVPEKSPKLPDGLSIDSNGCPDSLNPGEKCELKAIFQPKVKHPLRRAKLVVPVINLSSEQVNSRHATDIYAEALATSDANPADIQVSVTPAKGDFVSGSGLLDDPFIMSYLYGRKLDLVYTFTNRKGAGTAYNFNVAVNYLPVGVEAITANLANPCAINTANMTLVGGDSCSVILRLPKQAAFDGGFLETTGQFLSTNLPFTYTDDYYGFVNDEDVMASRDSVLFYDWLKGFNASFVSCTELDAELAKQSKVWRYAIKVKAGFSSADSEVSYPIKVMSLFSINGMPENSNTSCEIKNGETSCELEISNLPISTPAHKDFTAIIHAVDGNGNSQQVPFVFNLANMCKVAK
jgi:hypothetical protein